MAAAKRQNIQPDGLKPQVRDGHLLYSHVVSVEGKRLIYLAGQLARDGDGNTVGRGDMAAQIRQVGENIKTGLEAAGASLADIVKMTTFVTDIDEYFKHISVRMAYFSIGLPASTTVEVSRLSHPDFMVEIEAVAVIG